MSLVHDFHVSIHDILSTVYLESTGTTGSLVAARYQQEAARSLALSLNMRYTSDLLPYFKKHCCIGSRILAWYQGHSLLCSGPTSRVGLDPLSLSEKNATKGFKIMNVDFEMT